MTEDMKWMLRTFHEAFKPKKNESIDEWVDAGLPATNADGARLIGAGYQSADGESYFVADNEVSKKWSNTNVDIAATQPDPNNKDGSLLVTQNDTYS